MMTEPSDVAISAERDLGAVETVLGGLSPLDRASRFGSAGASGVSWLIAALRADERRHTFVARQNGRPVAVLDDAPAEEGAEFGVAVDTAHRRRGIATALVEAFLAEQRAAGADRAVAYVPAWNRASVALLLSLRFRRNGGDPSLLRFERALHEVRSG
jgi:ribosomal protein S18 acetylase RimI-like enzyme